MVEEEEVVMLLHFFGDQSVGMYVLKRGERGVYFIFKLINIRTDIFS